MEAVVVPCEARSKVLMVIVVAGGAVCLSNGFAVCVEKKGKEEEAERRGYNTYHPHLRENCNYNDYFHGIVSS